MWPVRLAHVTSVPFSVRPGECQSVQGSWRIVAEHLAQTRPAHSLPVKPCSQKPRSLTWLTCYTVFKVIKCPVEFSSFSGPFQTFFVPTGGQLTARQKPRRTTYSTAMLMSFVCLCFSCLLYGSSDEDWEPRRRYKKHDRMSYRHLCTGNLRTSV